MRRVYEVFRDWLPYCVLITIASDVIFADWDGFTETIATVILALIITLVMCTVRYARQSEARQ
jgi:hypothetical protein